MSTPTSNVQGRAEKAESLVRELSRVAGAAEKVEIVLMGAHAGLASVSNSAHGDCAAWCPMVQARDVLNSALAALSPEARAEIEKETR